MLIITLLPSFAVSNANETLVVSTEDTACDEVDIENGWETDPYQRLGVSSNDGVFGLPASYDPRDDDFLTEGKEQDKSLLCWMFSSVGAVEQYTSKLYGSKSETH